ncbi:MAG: hypothetical protein JJ992_02535, partial [Planctomycetes bacterium]|nr:hypothetical protein [Planctomycetota bacterium]
MHVLGRLAAVAAIFPMVGGLPVMADNKTPEFQTTIDFQSPAWNRDAWARIASDLDPAKQAIGHYRGQVMAVVDGEKIRVLCG